MRIFLLCALSASCCLGLPFPVYTSYVQSGSGSLDLTPSSYGTPFSFSLVADTGGVGGTLTGGSLTKGTPVTIGTGVGVTGFVFGPFSFPGSVTGSYMSTSYSASAPLDGGYPQFGTAYGTITYTSDPILVYGGPTTFVVPFTMDLEVGGVYVRGTSASQSPDAEFDYIGSGFATFNFTVFDAGSPYAAISDVTFVFAPEPSSVLLCVLAGIFGIGRYARRLGQRAKPQDQCIQS